VSTQERTLLEEIELLALRIVSIDLERDDDE
jgi:hypothetical protein